MQHIAEDGARMPPFNWTVAGAACGDLQLKYPVSEGLSMRCQVRCEAHSHKCTVVVSWKSRRTQLRLVYDRTITVATAHPTPADSPQPGPETSTTTDDIRQHLLSTTLRVSLPATATDTKLAGHSWRPKAVDPPLWDLPSDPTTSLEPLLPHQFSGRDDSSEVGFHEITSGSALDGATANCHGSLALARRRKHAQQGSREHVRGRTGAMPFMPGGESWNTSGNAATAAAAAEATSGAWLSELENSVDGVPLPRILAPGMTHGAFGAWQTDESSLPSENARPPGGITNVGEFGGQAPENVDATPQSKEPPTAKVAVTDLFENVWMFEEEEEDEKLPEHAGNASPRDALENMLEGKSNGEEELPMDMDVGPTKGEAISSIATEGAAKIGAAGVLDSLLPANVDIPGGVADGGDESDIALGQVLDATSVSEAWMGRRVSSGGGEGDAAAAVVTAVQATDGLQVGGGPATKADRKTWAVRASVKNLNATWERLKPGLAKQWPFELDVFQKEAVVHMEAGHSVFVAAHTSAGKTVAAEYAFALAAKHCTRAVYTSPIKTISNQKYRDFSGHFEVGLLTGDVSIKPESSCLIMTTEILRSMLYKGADIVRDIEWVVFDEVHYVNDVERGVVWEEVIIMLPEHVNLVLLSATVPNVLEFADWVGRTKRKVVHVTGTTRRPVPLEHCLYYAGQLYTLSTQETGYEPRGLRQAKEAHAKKHALPQTKAEMKAALPTGRGDGGGGGGRRGGGRGGGPPTSRQQRPVSVPQYGGVGSKASGSVQLKSEKSQWVQLIHVLKKRDLLPMVAFCFSKKRCDALADALRSLDLTTGSEKSEIHIFCDRALARLKGSDRELPQVLRVREMLKRGLGVHHAGLLPIVKEVVEMLFCRGVIKVLFCTETFAMGVNAPARTVVFQSLRKHDGRQFRGLLPGEYTQMAGRAGRRGLDSVGTVIIAAWDDIPEETDVRRLLTGAATKLESQFRLTYSMILNLLRVEDLTVEDMMKRSFAEFHAQRAQPETQEAMRKGQQALRRLHQRPWPVSSLNTSREDVEAYAEVTMAAERLGDAVQEAVMNTRGAATALTNGRVVLVRRQTTGVTELGVLVDAADAGSAGGQGLGKKRGGGGYAPQGAPQGTSSSNVGGGGGAGRQRVVLSLHRSSPLDDGVAASNKSAERRDDGSGARGELEGSAQVQTQALSGGGGGGGGGLKVLRRKDEDDDPFGGFSGMKLLKGGGGGAGGSRGRARIALPSRGTVGSTDYLLSEIPTADIVGICKVKIRVDAEEILAGDKALTAAAVNGLLQVQESAGASSPPLMDPIADLKLNSLELSGDVRERQRLLELSATMPAHRDPMLPQMLAIVRSERLLASRLTALARQTGDAGLAQLPEFHQRVAVLQRLGYLAADRTVTMKGRVACEINSGDELVATELIFGGVMTELSPEEAVALLSALVFQEKSEVEPQLPPRLVEARDESTALAYAAGEKQRECGLDILPEEFVLNTLKFGLMEVVYEWAKGTPFSEICGLTDVMEGSIVRAIVRLDETCREFRDAARVMGNTTLFRQMEEASAAIKRDIVFAASLYVA